MLKTLNKPGIDETYLKIIRAIYEKPIANIILNGKKTGSIPFGNWNKTRMPFLTTPIQHSIGSSGQSNQARKINKSIQLEKEEVKLSLYLQMALLYIYESPSSQPKIS